MRSSKWRKEGNRAGEGGQEGWCWCCGNSNAKALLLMWIWRWYVCDMATRRNTLVARLFPYVGYSCSLLEFQCTRTLRIRLACQVQPGDSCIRLQSRHSFLFSFTLSLSLLYWLCKYTPNYAAPHCSCINTSMPRHLGLSTSCTFWRPFHMLRRM